MGHAVVPGIPAPTPPTQAPNNFAKRSALFAFGSFCQTADAVESVTGLWAAQQASGTRTNGLILRSTRPTACPLAAGSGAHYLASGACGAVTDLHRHFRARRACRGHRSVHRGKIPGLGLLHRRRSVEAISTGGMDMAQVVRSRFNPVSDEGSYCGWRSWSRRRCIDAGRSATSGWLDSPACLRGQRPFRHRERHRPSTNKVVKTVELGSGRFGIPKRAGRLRLT